MSQTGILGINKLFTTGYKDPYSYTKWVKRDAQIINPVNNQVVFEQKNVEFPDDWSLNAVNIVAQKYFAGTPGSPEREFSLRQLIDRVVNTITTYGFHNG